MDATKVGSYVPYSSTPEYWKRTWQLKVQFSTLCIETGSDISFEVLSYAYMERARGYLGLGRYEEALADYEESLLRVPDNLQAHIGIGKVFLKLGNPERALAHAQVVLERLPDDFQALQLRMQAYCDLNFIELVPGGSDKCVAFKAIRGFEKAVPLVDEVREIERRKEKERQSRMEAERQMEIERQIREIQSQRSSAE